MRRTLRLTLAFILVALSWVYGGFGGVLTLVMWGIAVLPGLSLGFTLFGRRHAAGWIAGALIGYGLIAIGWWIPVALGAPSPAAFIFVWLMLLLLAGAVADAFKGPLFPLPEWTERDAAALLLVLHLVPMLVGSPFARAGAQDDNGDRAYRAYFSADLIWHMAVAREVARLEPKPRNPYFADEELHYYWTYFLPPNVIATRGVPNGAGMDTVEASLKIHAMMTSLLLVAMIYITAWSATGRRWAALTAAAIAIVAPSFEGLYALRMHLANGEPLAVLREINIDAVSAWPQYRFFSFRIDNLPRTMWWTAQHAMSCGLGLIAVLAASRWSTSWRGALLSGLALGLSVAVNPVVGAIFCAVFGLCVLVDAVTRRITIRDTAIAALSVIPVGIALAWCIASGMSARSGEMSFGLHDYARRTPVSGLFLSLGGVLVPALIALLPSRRVPFRPALPGLVALLVALVVMHFVTLTDLSWVGFRMGNIILVTSAMLIARALVLTEHRSGRTLTVAFAAVLLLGGAPTTAIDWFNARDVENHANGPGFPWTLRFSRDQQAGFEWVQRATPASAIVQFDPVVRGRADWSSLPSLAGRRMSAGLPLSQLPDAAQEARVARVHRLFTELPAEEARNEAAALGIQYLWIDDTDRAAPTGASLERLFARPDLFPPLFRQGGVAVLAVAR